MNVSTINSISKYFTIGALWLLVGCSSLRQSKATDEKACNENLEFKKTFFDNIQNVENLITKVQNESFKKSLDFISKYSEVSYESMANYARTYPYGAFENDKKKWLKWYEDNKCKNIQYKEPK
ncbi:MAG: hypothetical protein EOP48_14315 [Sphingobacteriales bacterium]|nr:MAG: hypothetical protein EOP48_14315 [Sphingobacteriales bacterium]